MATPQNTPTRFDPYPSKMAPASNLDDLDHMLNQLINSSANNSPPSMEWLATSGISTGINTSRNPSPQNGYMQVQPAERAFLSPAIMEDAAFKAFKMDFKPLQADEGNDALAMDVAMPEMEGLFGDSVSSFAF
jgi:hypothetical protein